MHTCTLTLSAIRQIKGLNRHLNSYCIQKCVTDTYDAFVEAGGFQFLPTGKGDKRTDVQCAIDQYLMREADFAKM